MSRYVLQEYTNVMSLGLRIQNFVQYIIRHVYAHKILLSLETLNFEMRLGSELPYISIYCLLNVL
jgi:hypothetical protein